MKLRNEDTGASVGSPFYMSPELVNGWHMLDGRSDIWSIGVILYESIAGARPFTGSTREELFEEIQHRSVIPPRMINPDLDEEIQRICLKCLAKTIRHQYNTADELADDLKAWLNTPEERFDNGHVPVVPQGLRSFNADDSHFFLQLLPGPRDRDGTPDDIRFWKTRINPASRKMSFPIGVIFGPSGAGKSSFIQAGLIPQLESTKVEVFYVEATAEDTVANLAQKLRERFPFLGHDFSVPQMLDLLREEIPKRQGSRVLVVLDQFEQWLFANKTYRDTQLVDALLAIL